MKPLKHFREKHGLNLSQLGRKAGIGSRRLGEIEVGKRLPSTEERQKLANLGCHLPPVDATISLSNCIRDWRSRPFELPYFSTQNWERALGKREETLPAWFRCSTECYSVYEADCWLDLGLYGAQAQLASPLAMGFRQHHVVDDLDQGLGERLRPCLVMKNQGTSLTVFPQLRVQTRRGTFKLDGLILICRGSFSLWVNLELDGAGHDFRRDEFRQAQLAMEVVRIRLTATWDTLWSQVFALLDRVTKVG